MNHPELLVAPGGAPGGCWSAGLVAQRGGGGGPYPYLMRSVPEEWECLRLAAKAADRMGVAEVLRPEFERRLTELGCSSLAIAHAFSLLSGPGTVAEALEELQRYGK